MKQQKQLIIQIIYSLLPASQHSIRQQMSKSHKFLEVCFIFLWFWKYWNQSSQLLKKSRLVSRALLLAMLFRQSVGCSICCMAFAVASAVAPQSQQHVIRILWQHCVRWQQLPLQQKAQLIVLWRAKNNWYSIIFCSVWVVALKKF